MTKNLLDKKPKIISIFFINLGIVVLIAVLIFNINKAFIWYGLFLVAIGLTILPLSTGVKK